MLTTAIILLALSVILTATAIQIAMAFAVQCWWMTSRLQYAALCGDKPREISYSMKHLWIVSVGVPVSIVLLCVGMHLLGRV